MTPGLVIQEGQRIRIRQLCEDDIPRMAAHGFGGEEGAKRWYARELEKADGPSKDFTQFAVETKSGEWIGFTGSYGEPGGDALRRGLTSQHPFAYTTDALWAAGLVITDAA
jgi:hypothetical protein